MEAYIERMIQEKKELDEKILKLSQFIYGENKVYPNLCEYQKELLREQKKYMEEYSKFLGKRIDFEIASKNLGFSKDNEKTSDETCGTCVEEIVPHKVEKFKERNVKIRGIYKNKITGECVDAGDYNRVYNFYMSSIEKGKDKVFLGTEELKMLGGNFFIKDLEIKENDILITENIYSPVKPLFFFKLTEEEFTQSFEQIEIF